MISCRPMSYTRRAAFFSKITQGRTAGFSVFLSLGLVFGLYDPKKHLMRMTAPSDFRLCFSWFSPFFVGAFFLLFSACSVPKHEPKTRIVFDTDANNELDDQHAMAYLLFNGGVFDVEGVTVNTTFNGGGIEEQYAEAKRVMQLCGLYGKIPLLKGADSAFAAIRPTLGVPRHDGFEAVDFIIEQAYKPWPAKPVVLAVGKLTNVALALEKDPTLADRIRVVWLGSNYPKPGEYNQDNDTAAMNYVLNTTVPFEMVTVRGGQASGTAHVSVTKEEILANMPGKGIKAQMPVEGRHGGTFTTFGDYSVNLFEKCDLYGNPPSRSLFDMAAVAILKNAAWAQAKEIPAPLLSPENQWQERPGNPRKITVWENFDRDAIMEDFYATMNKPVLAEAKQ